MQRPLSKSMLGSLRLAPVKYIPTIQHRYFIIWETAKHMWRQVLAQKLGQSVVAPTLLRTEWPYHSSTITYLRQEYRLHAKCAWHCIITMMTFCRMPSLRSLFKAKHICLRDLYMTSVQQSRTLILAPSSGGLTSILTWPRAKHSFSEGICVI